MQIRLTVLGPRSGRAARGSDVLVTAPAGTVLGSVAGALASAAGSGQPGRSAGSSVALYVGQDRVPPTAVLGVPPLVDGAVLSLHASAGRPGEPHDHGQYGSFGEYGRPSAEVARLLVVGGPDAGGVHLLPGGRATIGRSADADVPLDDPDVSRLHCEVAFGPDGGLTVADLGSTNGTTLSGRAVGPQPVPLPPGALLHLGESTLRLDPAGSPAPPPLPAAPDTDGHLRVSLRDAPWPPPASPSVPAPRDGTADASPAGHPQDGRRANPPREGHAAPGHGGGPADSRDGSGAAGHPEAGTSAPGTAGGRQGAGDGPGAHGRTAGQDGSGDPAPRDDAGAAGHPGEGGGPGLADASGAAGHPADGSRGRGSTAPDSPGTGGRRDTGQARRPGTGPGGRSGVVGSIGAWARRRLGGTGRGEEEAYAGGEAEALRERWPDPASVLLTALGPGRRLWERAPGHPDALTVRLGTADLPSEYGNRRLAAVPFTVDLRDPRTSALTLAGPRPRLAGLARAVLAQLCALHSPTALEVVLVSADRARPTDQRAEEWSWLNWLPHLRPSRGQDCRLLLAFDRDQAQARTAELLRRIEEGPAGAGHPGPYSLLVVDGDPGSAALRETVARIAAAGPAVGIHVLCLTEPGERPAVDGGVVARLSGDVATTLRVEPAGEPAGSGGADEIVLDAVSGAWAEHFARALAPLREADADAPGALSRHALPASVRLLDELDLALATPAKIAARWGAVPAAVPSAVAVLGAGAGAGPGGRVTVDLVAEGPHLIVGGAPGAGKTELLRSFAAALAAAERPDRLALILVDGAGQDRGEGLAGCADLPHVSAHLVASDPVRMREFAQALSAELKRREAVLDGQAFAAWHAERLVAATVPHQGGRPPAAPPEEVPALPRLVVLVDDFDALVAPALGAPGRPAAGSVVRAIESVARDGERLGVHLVAATGRPERTAGTDADERAPLRVALRMPDTESAALLVHVEDPAVLDESVPGRGYLRRPGGAVTAFQAGRVSGRIPRTATLRPTVVGLEWERMGDPPARRQVRELGNGPTDLALLASALQRAAEAEAASG
ncbi:FtsK/SpoIIIE domain-containing protein [Actinacidiphila paucisporea]|uniref:FtsK/SpoIIIE family protein n=1 Tax=Actinacidiphila paucisporea TaxID=310782 RepID=A0A1M6W9E0_9ACTN|nr:FtsK/SpoIIIE domain-containing protein [Actinacidiphila paucisporea]SHK90390.1 FtsK/SpoIIIE family protein [Actinacidiphila paucisporea]